MTRGRARGRGAGVGAREEAGLVVGGGLLGGGDAQREHLVPHGVQRLWNHLRPKPRRLRAGCRAQGRRRSGGGTCARAGGGAGGPCSSRSSRRRGRPLRTGPTFPPSPRPAPAPRSRPPAPTCARTTNKPAPPPLPLSPRAGGAGLQVSSLDDADGDDAVARERRVERGRARELAHAPPHLARHPDRPALRGLLRRAGAGAVRSPRSGARWERLQGRGGTCRGCHASSEPPGPGASGASARGRGVGVSRAAPRVGGGAGRGGAGRGGAGRGEMRHECARAEAGAGCLAPGRGGGPGSKGSKGGGSGIAATSSATRPRKSLAPTRSQSYTCRRAGGGGMGGW